MRRKDREIKTKAELLDILERCDTLSLGFNGKEYPYVVPVSFGVTQKDDEVIIYFHGSKQGLKVEMIENDSRVCIEGHLFHKVESAQHGITTRYESVIGFGIVEKAQDEEIISGLKSITSHYHYPDYPIDACTGLSGTAVYKIILRELTGKRNLAE